jgi:hypothetical protein
MSGEARRNGGLRASARSVLFRDPIALTLFLGTVLFGLTLWRLDVFITDNHTLVNTLVAVSDGHLWIDRFVSGGPASPGVRVVGDRLYGRNYGQVVLALPFLWALRATAVVADLRIAIAAGWSLTAMALLLAVGRLVERRRLLGLIAAALGLAGFAANVAVAEPVARETHYLMALSLSTVLATAGCVVLGYLLVKRMYGHRIGASVGAGILLATPLGFWAPIPKRHVLTTLLTLGAVYALYRSREATDREAARRFRALAYVPIGLTAWIMSPEGLVLAVAVAVADLTTARWNDPRTLAVVAAAAVAGGIPFLVTNVLISGNPIQPPFLLPPYRNASAAQNATASLGDSVRAQRRFVDSRNLLGKLVLLVSRLTKGIVAGVLEPERLYHTFVRSGYYARYSTLENPRAISVTILEAAPVLAGLVAAPLFAVRRVVPADLEVRATDTFAVVYSVLLTIVYLPGLPSLDAQLTVRYLLPLYVFGLYGLVRLPPVRQVLHHRSALVGWTYLATVLVGGQLVLAVQLLSEMGVGEAIQFQAVLGLASAAAVGGWALAAGTGRHSKRLGACSLGIAAGLATAFVLLMSLAHFENATNFALGAVDVFAEALAV